MREAEIQRDTKETSVHVRLNLDGNGNASIDTGVGFFNHMMELTAFHGSLDLDLHTDGDLDVDDHHTIEDCGLALGTAFRNASGDRKGIQRYGSVTLPMDEALVNVSMDISGRPYLVFNASFDRDSIGMLSTEMIEEFFRAFAMNAGVSLHINLLYGKNDHHKAEAIFKAFGRCMKQAAEITGTALPSTKGYLE